jgi:8-oxo-dGTP pyrophosphatase MutT (NUDIX family)
MWPRARARLCSWREPSAEVAEPRPSASVILVRDGAEGLETFMVRRHARSAVAPSAFPGGTLRADDLHFQPRPDCAALARLLSERTDTPVQPDQAAAFYVSALRELFEEAGVLLARDATGGLVTVDESDVALQERLESTRLTLQAHELSFARVLADWGWQPAFDLLVPFSHWVTPRVLAARFDTRFFVAEMPPGQAALHDTIETSEGVWLRPMRVLEEDYHTVYATAQHLRRLSPFASVGDLLVFARQKPIRRVSPEVVEDGSGLSVFIPPELVDGW